MREGAAARILAGEPHRRSFVEQRGEGEVLAGGPVERLVARSVREPGAGVEELGDLLVGDEALRDPRQRAEQVAQLLHRDRGVRLGGAAIGTAAVLRPEAGERRDVALEARLPRPLQDLFELLHPRDHELLALVARRDPRLLELARVDLAGRGLAPDHFVHDGLRESGLVGLVVPVLPVAVEVDEDVFLEGLSVFDGELYRPHHRFWILEVDVEHRSAQGARDVRAVVGRARVFGVGGEPDLVVDDDVDGAARLVALEVREIEAFRDQALPGEGGIAVDEHREHLLALRVAPVPVLLGADATFDDGVHPFEMARIERQAEVDLPPALRLVVGGVSEVVFHVAAAEHRLRVLVLELYEDLGDVLLHDVGEKVEAPAVRHADDDLFATLVAELLDEPVHERDEAFGAFQREALRADVLLVEEGLEGLGVGQPGEDAQLLLAIEARLVARFLHLLLQPLAEARILAVHVLGADGPAVRPAQARDDLAQREGRGPDVEVAGGEIRVEVVLGEPEVLDVQLVGGLLVEAEGIEIREQVAADPVGLDQLGDRLLLLFRGETLRLGRMIGQIEEGGRELPFRRRGTDGDLAVSVPLSVAVPVARARRSLGRLREAARLQGLRAGLRKRDAGKLGEVALPGLVHGLRVVAPALVLIVDEDLIDSEIAIELHWTFSRRVGARKIADAGGAGQRFGKVGRPGRMGPVAAPRARLETGSRGQETARARKMPGWRNGRRGALKTP